MTRVVVMGAGPAGMATAMVLGEEGLDVVVLDKDGTEPPEDAASAWAEWDRPGVAQFRQAHTIISRGRAILESRLPRVLEYLKALGGHEFSTLSYRPPGVNDWTPQPQDARYGSIGARRPVYELAFALAATESGNVEVRRGEAIVDFVVGPEAVAGVPHVAGVITSTGEAIPADLVVDAGGRRSTLPALLEHVGARAPEEQTEDSKFAYYTRFYRRRDGDGFPEPYLISLLPVGSISVLTLPGDNDTWSATLYATTSDRAMRAVRDNEVFDRVLAAVPPRAGWADGDPITDVHTMAGISDRMRSLVVDGTPVATGVVSVADAWACTNPSLGRGITMALMHVDALFPELVSLIDRPAVLAGAYHEITTRELLPWHDETLGQDRQRNADMDRIRLGGKPDTFPVETRAFFQGAATDQMMFRAAAEIGGLFSLASDVMARPEISAKVEAIAADLPEHREREILPRQELESLLA